MIQKKKRGRREKFDAPAFQQQLAILTGLQAHLISVTVHEQGK